MWNKRAGSITLTARSIQRMVGVAGLELATPCTPDKAAGPRLPAMQCAPSQTATRLAKRCAVLCLAAMVLPLLATGCTTAAPTGQTRFACYDVRGRLEPTIVTKSECEVREWEWRERP